MGFHEVDWETWPRAEHFQYYSNELKTNYQVTVQLDVTDLRTRGKQRGLRFYPTLLYVIMRGVNQNQEFRMAYHEGRLGFWDVCHPSYTIFHEDDKTFSDIWTEYSEEFPVFYRAVLRDLEEYKDVKGVKTKEGRPENFCPISGMPWISYQSVSHDTTGPSRMYYPVINFGRFTETNGRIAMPFSIYANHAAADGYHTSKLIQDIQETCSRCGQWM